jgi:uncharacterized protein
MEKIKETLKEIEHKKKIRILYSCETGSRAWGFPSPDSDYDVRFVYMHERDWYLSLSQRKDSIEFMSGELDITGWDLRKCLTLLKKSNAPLIERFNSPVIYQEEENFRTSFNGLIREYYSPTAVFFHHFSLAKKFREEMEGRPEIKLKSYFYMIRSLLSCKWISQEAAVVPMNIGELMKNITPEQKNGLGELIRLKSQVDEKYLHRRTPEMDAWMQEWFALAETVEGKLPVNQADSASLNHFFIQMLNKHADH